MSANLLHASVEGLRVALAGFQEAREVLPEPVDARTETEWQMKAYACQSCVSGLTELRTTAAKIAATSGAQVIFAHANVRAAALECAEAVEACAGTLGVAAGRIAAVVRRWVDTGSADAARTLASQCETAARLAKTRSVR